MKIRLDKARCAGHALCFGVDPRLFPLDEQGYSAVAEIAVNASKEVVAREGVSCCPESALALREEG